MNRRVAIVHYWLVNMGGGERVLEALCRLYPEADIFTHVVDRGRLSPVLASRRIQTTFIDRLPFARRRYRGYLPLMPIALEQLDLRDYDLVISSEAGPAKGVITLPRTLHLCYCHTPMRYLWDMFHDYREMAGALIRTLMPLPLHLLRTWDLASAARVDAFMANSRTVADRIRKMYRRDATVIYPCVGTQRFRCDRPRDSFYLAASRFVPYKRIDLVVDAFARLGLRLVVIGDGPELPRIRRSAAGHSNIRLLGRASDGELAEHLERCKAFVFAANEDFGILPVEAQAAGAPVIALGRGGAAETVLDGVTGIHFREQTIESLMDAVRRFESGKISFDPLRLRAHAEQFSDERFLDNFSRFVEKAWEAHTTRGL